MTAYEELPPQTRVWIYQANKPISEDQQAVIQKEIEAFVRQWTAHNVALRAHGALRNGLFIVLMVDESQAGASGCSIDTSVQFIQYLEQKYGLSLLDRMTFSYEKEGAIHTASRDEFADLFQAGAIDQNTIVFDNLVKTKSDLEKSWRKKLGESWHQRMLLL